MQEGSVDVN